MRPLADVIASENLLPCWFVRVVCKEHGEFRVKTLSEPNGHMPCPHCGNPKDYRMLGTGATRLAKASFQREDGFWLDPLERFRMTYKPKLD